MISKYGEDSELIDAYFKYGSCQKAANIFGCSYMTINRALARHGIKPDGRKRNGNHKGSNQWGGSPEKITDDEIKAECQFMTRLEIAAKHKMDITNVDRRLRRLGLTAKVGISEGRRNSHYFERCQQYGVEFDSSVTLSAVYKRDNGICKICGLPVDCKDRNKNIIGRLYPTIDHIIPLSKNGSHNWSNVQLAHMECNSRKCDKLNYTVKRKEAWT